MKTIWIISAVFLTIADVSRAAMPASLAIRNYRELPYAFSQATGVTQQELLAPNFQTEARPRLSSTGKVEEVNSVMMLTVSKLAYLYCRKFVEKESALLPEQRKAHKLVDFKKTRADLNDDQRKNVLENYANQFWRRPATADEITKLLSETKAIFDAVPASPTEVMQGLAGVCTAALSSLEVLKI